MDSTVAVAVAALAINALLAGNALTLQVRREKLSFQRSSKSSPYSKFGLAAERFQVRLDHYASGRVSSFSSDSTEELVRELEENRVETDLVGSKVVRGWAYRVTLSLRELQSALISGNGERAFYCRAKLHDARKEWVQCAREELGVTKDRRMWFRRARWRHRKIADGGHHEWLSARPTADGLKNASRVFATGPFQIPDADSRQHL